VALRGRPCHERKGACWMRLCSFCVRFILCRGILRWSPVPIPLGPRCAAIVRKKNLLHPRSSPMRQSRTKDSQTEDAPPLACGPQSFLWFFYIEVIRIQFYSAALSSARGEQSAKLWSRWQLGPPAHPKRPPGTPQFLKVDFFCVDVMRQVLSELSLDLGKSERAYEFAFSARRVT